MINRNWSERILSEPWFGITPEKYFVYCILYVLKIFDAIVNTDVNDDDDLLERLSVSKAEFYKILNKPLKNE